MKRFLLQLLLLLPLIGMAQQAEKIYSITKYRFPVDYYHTQVKLWKAQIASNDQDSEAWKNYYAASRMANLLRTTEFTPRYDLDEIVAAAAVAIPTTFEYHHIAYWNKGPSATHQHHLKAAYQIDPDRPELFESMISSYEMQRNQEKVAFFSQKLFDSQQTPTEIFHWNYNQLVSVADNAILLTFGDNDTYPSWMLQKVKSIKPEVAVINVHLLRDFDYRNKAFADYGIPPFQPGTEKVGGNTKDTLLAVLDHLSRQQERPLYFGVAIPGSLRDHFGDQLYLVGMAFKYSDTAFDNLTVLRQHIEEDFLLDEIKTDLDTPPRESTVHRMNANYIPGFLLLYDLYQKEGDFEKAESLKTLISQLAIAANMDQHLDDYFKEQPTLTAGLASVIDIKKIEKELQEIQPGWYASATEVSNEAYETFLIDLLKQKKKDLLAICQTEKIDWRQLAKERLNHTRGNSPNGKLINQGKDEAKQQVDYSIYAESDLFENGHPDDPDFPVQNISHEAATIYCQWITQVYNQSDHKKKRFKKVNFRLPTEAEWEYAAKSGKEQAIYPWHGYYVQNEKGCFILNANVSGINCQKGQQKYAGNDGGFFPVVVDAYFPNKLGLYNTSGNVAEMLEEVGIIKGGSWADTPEHCRLDHQQTYNGPDPTIGFRIFMEVVER